MEELGLNMFFETSSKENKGIEEMFNNTVEKIIDEYDNI